MHYKLLQNCQHKKIPSSLTSQQEIKIQKITGTCTNLQWAELSIYSKSNSILGFQITRPNLNKAVDEKSKQNV